MKFGLSSTEIAKIIAVFKKYPQIHSVVIYGSRSMGNYKRGSDIDLALMGNPIDLQTLSKISNDLDDLFLPYQFDISCFNDIQNKELVDHIQRRGQIFYDPQS
jgi:uncharacterized protein